MSPFENPLVLAAIILAAVTAIAAIWYGLSKPAVQSYMYVVLEDGSLLTPTLRHPPHHYECLIPAGKPIHGILFPQMTWRSHAQLTMRRFSQAKRLAIYALTHIYSPSGRQYALSNPLLLTARDGPLVVEVYDEARGTTADQRHYTCRIAWSETEKIGP